MTEIVFDTGVDGQLTYVWPLQYVNYHLSYCVHILYWIWLSWQESVILFNVLATHNSTHIAITYVVNFLCV